MLPENAFSVSYGFGKYNFGKDGLGNTVWEIRFGKYGLGNRFRKYDSGNTVSGNTVSGNTVSGNTVSGNTVLGNTVWEIWFMETHANMIFVSPNNTCRILY